MAGVIAATMAAPQGAAAQGLLGNLFGGSDEAAEPQVIDPRDYSVRFEVSGDVGGLDSRLKAASALWSERDGPAAGAAGLITRAQGDYRSLVAQLFTEARYGGTVSIRINGREAAALSPADPLADPIDVRVVVAPGPEYAFSRARYVNPPPRPLRARRTEEVQDLLRAFRPGQPARADLIARVEDKAIDDWRAAGHPFARIAERRVVADHAARRLAVTLVLEPGPQAKFGDPEVAGSGRVDPDFVEYIADIPVGGTFTPRVLRQAEERLTNLGVFSAVTFREGETLQAGDALPLVIDTIPRKPRRFGLGATLSSTEGLGLEGFWLHRNAFGRAERLRFDASVAGIGDRDDFEDYDYGLSVSLAQPGVLDPDVTLESRASLEQNVFDLYTERAARVGSTLRRRFDERFSGRAGAQIALSETEDAAGTRRFVTLSLPASGIYDDRNDPLDPTRGIYGAVELAPFYETEFATAAFRTRIEGRAYWELIPQSTTVAARGAYGVVLGGDLDDISPDQLFFTGGGGSVRGYEFQNIGRDPGADALGGRSVLEGSVEVRQRIRERYGVVGFLDAGIVSGDELPGPDDDLRLGAGLGARFYTGIGPIRVDVARAVDPRPQDPSITFYVGIGQAF